MLLCVCVSSISSLRWCLLYASFGVPQHEANVYNAFCWEKWENRDENDMIKKKKENDMILTLS